MPLMCGGVFLGGRTLIYPAVAAVVADAVHRRRIVDHRCVVNVVNLGDVYVVNRAVVVKVSAVPAPALIAMTEVAVAVIDPAIETYVGTPVPVIEVEPVPAPGPISRRPEQTGFWSQHPCSRHPIIIVVAVGPVSGYPNIILAGAKRLVVDRQGRGTDRD